MHAFIRHCHRVSGHPLTRWGAMAIVVLLLLVGSLHHVLAWSPIAFIKDTNPAMWPHVRVSGTGAVNVLWNDFDSKAYHVLGQLDGSGNAITWDIKALVTTTEVKGNGIGMAVDSAGKVHIAALGRDHKVYYLYSDTGKAGTWGKELTTLDECGWGVDIAVDTAGVPYVTCGIGLGDGNAYAEVAYQQNTNAWAPPKDVIGPRGYVVRGNQIAVTGSGSNANVHVFYEYVPKKGQKALTHYSRGPRDGPYGRVDITTKLGYAAGEIPSLTADPATGRLYGAFVTGGTSSGYKHVLTTSPDQGNIWAPIGQISLASDKWAAYSDIFVSGGIGHFITEHKYYDGKAFETHRIFYNTFNPSNNTLSAPVEISAEEKSTAPTIGGGGTGKVGVWMKGNTDGIRYRADPGGASGATPVPPTNTPVPATPTPEVVQPKGTMKIGDGAETIAGTTADVTLSLEEGNADKYILWNKGASEPSTFKAFDSTRSAPASYIEKGWSLATSSSSACYTAMVYGKFQDSTSSSTSEQMEASIEVDPGVDATVDVIGYSQGDPSYASQPYYRIEIEVDPNKECSGLKSMRIGEGTSPTSTVTLNEMALDDPKLASGWMVLDPASTGKHEISIELTDHLDNQETYTHDIIYDIGPPQVISATGSMRITKEDNPISSSDTTWVDVSFEGVEIEDFLDSGRTQKVTDQPFWGVMMANSREVIPISDTQKLDGRWVPMPAENVTLTDGTYSFTVSNWDLFNSITRDEQTEGDFYIYAYIIDGAGNIAQTTDSVGNIAEHPYAADPLELEPHFSVPGLYLPLVTR